MPCNAHNHPRNCDCGWGGMWHGNVNVRPKAVSKRASLQSFESARDLRDGHHKSILGSITIPNAKCPVCLISVFYYQNAFGSRVFFDSLGPPWPKHHCTDNARWRADKIHRILSPSKPPRPRAAFVDSDWKPYLFVALRPSFKSDNRVIILESKIDGTLLKLFLNKEMTTPSLANVYARVTDLNHYEVSYIDDEKAQPFYRVASGYQAEPKSELTEFELFRHRVRQYERSRLIKEELDNILRNRYRAK